MDEFTYSTRNSSQRFYLLDYPVHHDPMAAVERILQTCNCFYVVGGKSTHASLNRQAARHWEQLPEEVRHRLALGYISFLQKALPKGQRLSIYTRDSVLNARILAHFPHPGPLDFFHVFFIRRDREPGKTFDEVLVEPLQEIKQSPPFSQLALRWRIETADQFYTGNLILDPNEATAHMEVHFLWRDKKVMLLQTFTYFYLEYEGKATLLLNGKTLKTENPQLAVSYAKDHLDLYFTQDSQGKWSPETPFETHGYCFSSAGFGDVFIDQII